MNEKLNEIYKMVDFILDPKNEDEVDTITLYQCELPSKLKGIETELRTMFEGYED